MSTTPPSGNPEALGQEPSKFKEGSGRHPLEEAWKASASDILSAIQHGFRAQVDVKGKLAEFYLDQKLAGLLKSGKVGTYEWRDKDGVPDFGVQVAGGTIQIECKNVRSGTAGISKKPPGYKVELQKTRNSKDGSNTRGYKVGEFEVLAACLFNQTGKWEYLYIATKFLQRREKDKKFLKIMQHVPPGPSGNWRSTLEEAIGDALEKKRQFL